MTTYRVSWEIDVEADSVSGAALQAWEIMKDNSEDNEATILGIRKLGAKEETLVDVLDLNLKEGENDL